MKANQIAPDGVPRFAASHLGLFYLPMSHKNDARLILVKGHLLRHTTTGQAKAVSIIYLSHAVRKPVLNRM